MASRTLTMYRSCGCRNTGSAGHFKRVFKRIQRKYCSADPPPLNVPLQEFAPPGVIRNERFASGSNNTNSGFRVTTLPNGLKVASEDSFGQFCTVGVLIDAGSRYEVDYPDGLSHMLEKMAFQSTSEFESYKTITGNMEKLGGMIDCQSFRDCMIYAASALTSNLAGTMHILSQAVWHPLMTEEELEEQKRSVEFELEQLDFRPEPEPQMTDLIHAAAFQGNTLGLPKICPMDSLTKFTPSILNNYMKRYYTPLRMTVAAVNVDHDELVQLSERFFQNQSPVWQSSDMKVQQPDASIAQYSPGMVTDISDSLIHVKVTQQSCPHLDTSSIRSFFTVRHLLVDHLSQTAQKRIPTWNKEHRSQPRIQPGINPLPELAHIAVGFEGASFVDQDFFAFAVINMLLGGGGSFSAGGPGKGLYTRLYLNVLNRFHWIHSATAFNHSYADGGIFTILASAHPSQVKELVQVIMVEFLRLVHGQMHKDEVNRAKKQLQSMLMMNLESRVTVFEDIGRQILGLGYRKSPQELFESIEAVSMDDLKRASEKMLSSRPAIAAMGDLTHLPDYAEIQKALSNQGKIGGGVKRFFLNRFSP